MELSQLVIGDAIYKKGFSSPLNVVCLNSKVSTLKPGLVASFVKTSGSFMG